VKREQSSTDELSKVLNDTLNIVDDAAYVTKQRVLRARKSLYVVSLRTHSNVVVIAYKPNKRQLAKHAMRRPIRLCINVSCAAPVLYL
jgi:hypothetical protein